MRHIELVFDGCKLLIGSIILIAIVLGPPAMVMHDMLTQLSEPMTAAATVSIVSDAVVQLLPWSFLLAMAWMMLGVMRR